MIIFITTGKLTPGGMHRRIAIRITDRHDMTSDFYSGRKALNKTKHYYYDYFVRRSDILLCFLCSVPNVKK